MQIKNIILAVELFGDERTLVQKGFDYAKKFNAKLTLVHAIEHVVSYGASYGVAVGVEVEEALLESATKAMRKLGRKLGVSEKNQIIKFGTAKFLVLEEAERIKADLIIVGSHGRHGIQLILGSTANAILHNSKFDVLAISIKK